MKDYVNYLKFTWTYYASVLLVAMVLVIESNVFTIKDMALDVTDKGVISNLSYVFFEKIHGNSLINLFTIVIAIFVMLLVRHLPYADKRKLEFLYLLPVKNSAFYVVDYVMHCLVLLAVAVVDYVMYLFTQQQHNNQVLLSNPNWAADNGVAKQLFNSSAIHYYLMIFVIFNVLYFGLTVAKNPIFGMIFSGVLLFLCWFYVDVWGIEGIVSSGEMMKNITDGQSYVLSLVIVNVCFIIGISIVIHFRELHKGSLCYHSVFEYSAFALIAMLVATLIFNFMGSLLPIVIVAGVVVFVILVIVLERKKRI